MSDTKPKMGKGKISAGVSTILWVLGFGLCFVIPAGSSYSWIADFLLLAGFVPLLWLYPAGWPWVVFGILNFGIGVVLEVGYHLPSESFTPEMNKMRLMLQGTHPTLVWMIVGIMCTVFGLFRMLKNGILFFRKRRGS